MKLRFIKKGHERIWTMGSCIRQDDVGILPSLDVAVFRLKSVRCASSIVRLWRAFDTEPLSILSMIIPKTERQRLTESERTRFDTEKRLSLKATSAYSIPAFLDGNSPSGSRTLDVLLRNFQVNQRLRDVVSDGLVLLSF